MRHLLDKVDEVRVCPQKHTREILEQILSTGFVRFKLFEQSVMCPCDHKKSSRTLESVEDHRHQLFTITKVFERECDLRYDYAIVFVLPQRSRRMRERGIVFIVILYPLALLAGRRRTGEGAR